MTIYFIVIFLWTLFGCVNIYRSQDSLVYSESKGKKYFTVLCVSLIFVLMAFKDVSVGTDTYSYYQDYLKIQAYRGSFWSIFKGFDFGYDILMYFGNKLNMSFQLFNGIISLFVCYALSKFINKNSINPYLFLIMHLTVGWFDMSMSGIRQTLAIAITLLAFMNVQDRKYIKAFLLIAVSFTVHYSAIVFLPLLFINVLKFKSKKRMFLILMIPVVPILFSNTVLELFKMISSDRYFINGYFDSSAKLNPLVYLLYGGILIVCFILLCFKDDDITDREYHYFLLSSIYLVFLFTSNVVYMSQRLGYYFLIFPVLLLSNVLTEIKDRKLKAFGEIVCMFVCILKFIVTTPGSVFKIDNFTFYF